MDKIRFGTDGWRAVIAEGFTFRNVERLTQAIADYVGKGKEAVVGYDTRFMSDQYAQAVAEVLSGNGIKVILANHPTPTPMLSYSVKNGADCGVIVTASHNPAIYNGIKFKESFGGSALPSTTKKIEELIDKSSLVKNNRLIEERDISQKYLDALSKYIDKKSMKRKRLKVIVDSMYGAGGFYLEDILKKFGHEVITIHGEPNPLFPGINPEPISVNIKELSRKVRLLNADIGIATDGDADRIGVVNDKGDFLTPHQVLGLLFLHLKTSRNWDGIVVKTISTTSLINRIAEKYNTEVKETPVGFKYVAEWMLKENVIVGGEESGGNGFMNHIPERDGLLSGLLLVEMMGHYKKGIRQLLMDMEKEFGPFRYKRVDKHIPRERILRLYEVLKANHPSRIAGQKVVEIKTFDGIKFIMEDGSWLLLRASGTEPLLRIYAEASDKKKVNRLIAYYGNLKIFE